MFAAPVELTIKPSDKRSNIYKYINIPKKVLIINIKENLDKFNERIVLYL